MLACADAVRKLLHLRYNPSCKTAMVTLQAYSEINNTIIEILKNRPLKDETFAQIFKYAFVLASLDGGPGIPRQATVCYRKGRKNTRTRYRCQKCNVPLCVSSAETLLCDLPFVNVGAL